jgi:hypothetical protein
MAGMFKIVDGETAILRQSGVYKEADLYTRNEGELYAKVPGGFIRLYADGATSKSNIMLDTLGLDSALYKDRFGKLCVADGKGRTALPNTPEYVVAALEDHSDDG